MSADAVVLAGRHLRLMARRPASVLGAVVFPLIFALLFFTVFGRVMERAGYDYVFYLLPAVIVQACFFTAMASAVLSAEDTTGGTLRRLRTMPVNRSAPILGLLTAAVTRAAVSMVVLVPLALALGFRFRGSFLATAGFVVLLLAFAAALCTCFIAMGLALRRVEAVQPAVNLVYFPFLLLSSAFAPASAFPAWLCPVVEHQPVSRVLDASRALADTGVAVARPLLFAGLWLAALTVLGLVLGTRAMGRSI
ncbi:ABC transporter permease [Micromonospora craniellae]|uniref:Transport permease protein n=1 Tax=Micromonospora craniellae TaxID=2294034 RepID=A0A372G4F0_9ACTN|nr:ABC transporter permease [Micromonospora craniellae]QOC92830.1 ABC transporter permease [Micromonospora craniellae]RFS47610.1 ABC transporter [Micromonospora craniellae]